MLKKCKSTVDNQFDFKRKSINIYLLCDMSVVGQSHWICSYGWALLSLYGLFMVYLIAALVILWAQNIPSDLIRLGPTCGGRKCLSITAAAHCLSCNMNLYLHLLWAIFFHLHYPVHAKHAPCRANYQRSLRVCVCPLSMHFLDQCFIYRSFCSLHSYTRDYFSYVWPFFEKWA